jgi:Polysaccharide pyruvyl transferase
MVSSLLLPAKPVPLVLFGACDRHNLGDLLFPHIVAKLLEPREVVVAGLAARDLTPFGGHRVRAIGEVLRELPGSPVIHVGGELLTCDAWEAAVMLLPPEEVPGVIARYDGRPERFDWARQFLGLEDRAPYCLGKSQSLQHGAVIFNGVGGVDLGRRDPALREEVLAKLGQADWIGVRDRATLALLAAAGVSARLMPDPAVLTRVLFGERIRARAEAGEPAAVRADFPQGYVAVQVAASLGDDATLSTIAAGLARLAKEKGVVFFRAGAAPWHDDLDVCRRAAALLPGTRIFESIDIWDICALIASSAGFAGSSLHGRIVAEACGVPVAEGVVPIGPKVAAYRQTWRGDDAVAAYRAAWADMLKATFGNT